MGMPSAREITESLDVKDTAVAPSALFLYATDWLVFSIENRIANIGYRLQLLILEKSSDSCRVSVASTWPWKPGDNSTKTNDDVAQARNFFRVLRRSFIDASSRLVS